MRWLAERNKQVTSVRRCADVEALPAQRVTNQLAQCFPKIAPGDSFHVDDLLWPARSFRRPRAYALRGVSHFATIWAPRAGQSERLLEPVVGVGLVVERGNLVVARGPVQADRLAQRAVGFQADNAGSAGRRVRLQVGEEPAAEAQSASRGGQPTSA